MAQQQQLQEKFGEMALKKGQQHTLLLKNIVKNINDLDVDDYGVVEDKSFSCPHEVQREYVDKVCIQKDKQFDRIKHRLELLKKMMSKLNRDIKKHQATKYKHLVLKKRNRDCERSEEVKRKARHQSEHL